VLNTQNSRKFFDQAIDEHNRKNEVLNRKWEFDNYQSWGFDQDSLLFFIELPNGSLVEAKGQIYGTFSPSEGTWEWAWANADIDEAASQDALNIKEYGERENVDFLSEPLLELPDQNSATYLGAIGEKVNVAQGLFVGEVEGLYIFIGLKELTKKSL